MNLQKIIDLILEKILGADYTLTHVIVLIFIIWLVFAIFRKGGKKR